MSIIIREGNTPQHSVTYTCCERASVCLHLGMYKQIDVGLCVKVKMPFFIFGGGGI